MLLSDNLFQLLEFMFIDFREITKFGDKFV